MKVLSISPSSGPNVAFLTHGFILFLFNFYKKKLTLIGFLALTFSPMISHVFCFGLNVSALSVPVHHFIIYYYYY